MFCEDHYHTGNTQLGRTKLVFSLFVGIDCDTRLSVAGLVSVGIHDPILDITGSNDFAIAFRITVVYGSIVHITGSHDFPIAFHITVSSAWFDLTHCSSP